MTTTSAPCPPRYSTPRNPDRPTLGPAVAQVARRLGTPLMPWQQLVADVALEVNPVTRRLAYRTVIVTVPRQQGKTTLILALAVHRAIGFNRRQRITYTAQTGVDAREKWQDDWLPILEESAYRTWYKPRKTNGHEAVLWGPRGHKSVQDLMATTKKAGHGKTRDLGIIDEAFAQVDNRIEGAMSPSMITRPSAQLWIPSTQGDADSVYFADKCALGRSIIELGDPDATVCYFEWSADPELDRTDPATWRSCMPALGITVDEATIRAELEKMADNLPEFDRAYLNIRNLNRKASPFGADVWQACMDRTSQIAGRPSIAVDVAPDGAWSAIGAAGYRADGLRHYEVIDSRPGTDWLVTRAAQVTAPYGSEITVARAPAPVAALVPAFERAGLKVRQVGGSELAAACGSLYTAFTERQARHIDQPSLNAAAEAAVRLHTGDGWVWSRRSSAADISPLVAITVAAWALETPEARRPEAHGDIDDDELDALVAELESQEAAALAELTA